MTRRRWIADEVSGNHAALVGAHAEHLSRVLRAHMGQEFDISTGNMVRRGRIIAIEDGRIEFELAEEVPGGTELAVTLLLSIFKFDRMEWAIEKCTELGIKEVVPVIAERTDPHLRRRPERESSGGGGSRGKHRSNLDACTHRALLIPRNSRPWRISRARCAFSWRSSMPAFH